MTQKERTLLALQKAGDKGVHSFYFHSTYNPRAAARVIDLKNEGYVIESVREGKGCRYILKG